MFDDNYLWGGGGGGRIEKWSRRGCVLEHLESSGTKIMMNGPIVHK